MKKIHSTVFLMLVFICTSGIASDAIDTSTSIKTAAGRGG